MTKWIEGYRQRAEERFERLDAVLAEMNDKKKSETKNPMEGTAS
jgi:ferritin-like metal-binding protein YciE